MEVEVARRSNEAGIVVRSGIAGNDNDMTDDPAMQAKKAVKFAEDVADMGKFIVIVKGRHGKE